MFALEDPIEKAIRGQLEDLKSHCTDYALAVTLLHNVVPGAVIRY